MRVVCMYTNPGIHTYLHCCVYFSFTLAKHECVLVFLTNPAPRVQCQVQSPPLAFVTFFSGSIKSLLIEQNPSGFILIMTHWRGPLSCRMSHILDVSHCLLMVLSVLLFYLMACISILQFHFVLLEKLSLRSLKEWSFVEAFFVPGTVWGTSSFSYLWPPLHSEGLWVTNFF